jgi:alkylation response protein AidB-like acyl-CoA dehydrogenase
MRFSFSDEQKLFQRTVRELLARACPPEVVRAAWQPGAPPGPAWARLAEAGALGLTAPEGQGGLGGDALDWILVMEEVGRAALPEPFGETVAVAAPLLARAGGLEAEAWLAEIAAGSLRVAVGLDGPLIADADRADLLLLASGDAVHAVPAAACERRPQPAVDGGRRLFRVVVPPGEGTLVGDAGALDAARDRGALAAAAALLGLGRRMLEMAVDYVKVRRQFGQAVGAFQAVKHHLADALVGLELARPLVHRAAWSMARGAAETPRHVSMAKASAGEAAHRAARAALQCHGAIGYSFEYDLQLYMKRAWALAAAFGTAGQHRARLAAHIFGG